MKIKLIAAVVVAGLLATMVGAAYINRRNQMRSKDQAVAAQWRQLEVFLQRRSNLILHLLDAARASPGPADKIAEITKARAALQAAQTPGDQIAANTELAAAVAGWLVEASKDRRLESDEAFLELQDELAGTDNRIGVESRRYNELVQDYDGYIALFPNTVFARWAGFQRNKAYFPIDAASSK